MNTEPLQRSIRPPSFGRDVFNFAFWTALGLALAVFATVTLLGHVSAKSMGIPALLAAVGFGGGWFAIAIERRRATYDLWHVVPVTSQQPAPAAPSQTAEEHYWVELNNVLLRLPAEPKPGAMRQFFSAIATGKGAFTERGAAEYGYSRRQWIKLRDRFIQEGWGEQKSDGDPQQGLELTVGGMDIIRAVAANRPPTPFDAEPTAPVLPTHARTNARTNAPVHLGKRVV